MASLHQDDASKVSARRTLRALNSVSGLCGFILNSITLIIERSGDHGNAITQLTSAAYIPIVVSIVWNHFDIRGLQQLPKGRNWAAMVVDAGVSLAFLALIVGHGIIMSGVNMNDKWKIMLFTYNTMPWIICDVLHLFLAFQLLKDTIGFNPTWRLQSICSNCQGKLSNTSGRTGDGAKYRLLDDQINDDDLENNRGQGSRQKKGPIHLADDA